VTRAALVNGGALALALLAAVAGGLDRSRSRAAFSASDELTVTAVRRVRLPDGRPAVLDSAGHPVPLRPYQRILSTNLLSDRLLLELCEPTRVLGFSRHSVASSPWRWRFAGKAAVDGFGPVEPLIALKPDLVLMNVFGTDRKVQLLRQAGIEVFNLGELRGVTSLIPMAEIIGELVGDGERGRRFAAGFQTRLGRVAAPLRQRPRRRALFLSVYAGRLLGGTRGTSYHDVLHYGGLTDVAARDYRDWPLYRAEAVAQLDPELVITKDGAAEAVCTFPGLERIAACREPGRVITLPDGLLDEPGVAILDAAEQVFARAYPELARAAAAAAQE
jgi:iron complex transport system substrate-binding protein